MHQVAVDAEGAEFDLGVVETDRGLVGDRTVSMLRCQSLATLTGAGGFGIGQGRLLGDAAGNALANFVGVEIEPRLDIRRELIADIAAAACRRCRSCGPGSRRRCVTSR